MPPVEALTGLDRRNQPNYQLGPTVSCCAQPTRHVVRRAVWSRTTCQARRSDDATGLHPEKRSRPSFLRNSPSRMPRNGYCQLSVHTHHLGATLCFSRRGLCEGGHRAGACHYEHEADGSPVGQPLTQDEPCERNRSDNRELVNLHHRAHRPCLQRVVIA